jgi:hypothetical protein
MNHSPRLDRGSTISDDGATCERDMLGRGILTYRRE